MTTEQDLQEAIEALNLAISSLDKAWPVMRSVSHFCTDSPHKRVSNFLKAHQESIARALVDLALTPQEEQHP